MSESQPVGRSNVGSRIHVARDPELPTEAVANAAAIQAEKAQRETEDIKRKRPPRLSRSGASPETTEARFHADATEDGTPIVLDFRHLPRRVVVGCYTDQQAERVAAFLNKEFPTDA